MVGVIRKGLRTEVDEEKGLERYQDLLITYKASIIGEHAIITQENLKVVSIGIRDPFTAKLQVEALAQCGT
ncbi:hypothetical protein G9A89_003797 [Geosiphon pyriformis]|nr:hypothetical protein G9A89_003797 [Geosiphon pyriformis]